MNYLPTRHPEHDEWKAHSLRLAASVRDLEARVEHMSRLANAHRADIDTIAAERDRYRLALKSIAETVGCQPGEAGNSMRRQARKALGSA